MRALNIAFIGGAIDSAIGYTHFVASKMDNRFRLQAGCFSRDKLSNQKTAKLWGEEDFRLYDDYRALLHNEVGNIEVICVLTPTTSHKQIVCEALELGYYVICEKTLCVSTEEALEIKELLQRQEGFLAVTYNYTGYPMLRVLKQMIEDNAFGKLHDIQIEMPQEGFIVSPNGLPPSPQSWRQKDLSIAIISLDLGVHIKNILSFLSNSKPISLYATARSTGEIKEVIDDVNVIVNLERDLVANIWYSKSALGYRNGLKVRVFGERAGGLWIQSNPEELVINTKSGERIIKDRASPNIAISHTRFKAGHPAGFIEAFANYYSDIADAISSFKTTKRLESKYVFGIDSALDELIFFEAVSKSYKNNEIIKF